MEDRERKILQEAHEEFDKKNYRRAEELYTRFIERVPAAGDDDDRARARAADVAVAYNNRGQVKYLRVDFSEAVEDFSASIRHRRSEVPLYNRGLIRYRLGFFQEAERDFRRALEINPEFKDAKESLNQTLLDREEKLTRPASKPQ